MVTAGQGGFNRFAWVTDHMPSGDRLARSSAPSYAGKDSGQKLTDDSIQFLKEQNLTHVISLNSEANDEAIKKKLKDNDIAYTPLPVKDFTAPTLDQLSTGNTAYRNHRAGTLVWCGYGHGRTGTMITALQIYAEKDREGSDRKDVTHDDYEQNRVETVGQFEVLDVLNNGIK
jgi:hypothetical protein